MSLKTIRILEKKERIIYDYGVGSRSCISVCVCSVKKGDKHIKDDRLGHGHECQWRIITALFDPDNRGS